MSIYCCMNSANKSPLSLRSTSSNCHVLFGYLIVLCTYHLTIAQQARDAVAVTSTRCRGCHEHGTPWLSWARDALAVISTGCRGCHEQTSDQCTTNHVDVNWTVTVTMIIRFRLTSELNVNNTACSCARERSYMRTTVADGHKFSAVRCLRRKLLDQS